MSTGRSQRAERAKLSRKLTSATDQEGLSLFSSFLQAGLASWIVCKAFPRRRQVKAVHSEPADPMLALMAYIFDFPLEVKSAQLSWANCVLTSNAFFLAIFRWNFELITGFGCTKDSTQPPELLGGQTYYLIKNNSFNHSFSEPACSWNQGHGLYSCDAHKQIKKPKTHI